MAHLAPLQLEAQDDLPPVGRVHQQVCCVPPALRQVWHDNVAQKSCCAGGALAGSPCRAPPSCLCMHRDTDAAGAMAGHVECQRLAKAMCTSKAPSGRHSGTIAEQFLPHTIAGSVQQPKVTCGSCGVASWLTLKAAAYLHMSTPRFGAAHLDAPAV